MWRRGVCPLHATEARPEQQSHVSSEPWWRGLQNRTCFVFASEETLWEGYCFWRQDMPGEAAHSHLVCFFELFWAYDVTCKHEGGPHDAPNVPACWCHPDFNMLNTPFGNSRVEVFLSYWALGSIASAATKVPLLLCAEPELQDKAFTNKTKNKQNKQAKKERAEIMEEPAMTKAARLISLIEHNAWREHLYPHDRFCQKRWLKRLTIETCSTWLSRRKRTTYCGPSRLWRFPDPSCFSTPQCWHLQIISNQSNLARTALASVLVCPQEQHRRLLAWL